jgi:hypothetical protein
MATRSARWCGMRQRRGGSNRAEARASTRSVKTRMRARCSRRAARYRKAPRSQARPGSAARRTATPAPSDLRPAGSRREVGQHVLPKHQEAHLVPWVTAACVTRGRRSPRRPAW